MWIAVGCCLALCSLPQEPGTVLVEVEGGIRISEDDYRDWLRSTVGGARIEEMLFDRILEREGAVIPDADRPADLAPVLADPDRAAAARIDRRVESEYGGDRGAWRDALAARATTESEALGIERVLALREARTALLVRAARSPTAADLERAFEDRYGPGGVRTRARHVLVSLSDTRQRLGAARRGPPLTDDAVRDLARAEAERVVARAREPGGLEALGPAPVPDGFERFAGDAFEQALRSQEPGTVSDPVESRFGYHVIEVLGRTITRFQDVADDVRREWMRAPPSLAEQRRLRERLYDKYDVPNALRRRAVR